MKRTVTIPSHSVPAAHKALDRLNRAAARHGLGARVEFVSVSKPRETTRVVTVREAGDQGTSSVELVEVVDFAFEQPEFAFRRPGGWSLGAVVEATDAGLDVSIIDERVRPVAVSLKNASFECAHCKARRARNKVLVAIDDAGDTRLLGTECAKAFISSIENDLFALQFVDAIDIIFDPEGGEFEGSGGGRGLRAWPLDVVLGLAAAKVEASGYVAKWVDSVDGNFINSNATALAVQAALVGDLQIEVDNAAREEAAKVAEWLLSLDAAAQHDALRSAIDAATIGLVSVKKLGAVVYAVQARRNALDAAAREAAKLAAGAQDNLAPEGRLAVSGVVRSTKEVESMYGMQHKMTVDLDGPAPHAFTRVYCSVPAALGRVERGDRVEFVATFERSLGDPRFAFGSRPSVPKGKKAA
jgi:hypothetical protein